MAENIDFWEQEIAKIDKELIKEYDGEEWRILRELESLVREKEKLHRAHRTLHMEMHRFIPSETAENVEQLKRLELKIRKLIHEIQIKVLQLPEVLKREINSFANLVVSERKEEAFKGWNE